MKRFLILTTVFLALILGGFAFYYANLPVAGVSGVKPEYSFTSGNLYHEFDENEEASNQKYLGKVIEVSGTVKESVKDENGQASITLDGDGMFGITCKLNDNDSKTASKIQPGDQVKVKGVCSGKLMDVVLVNCSFEKS